MSFPLPPNEAHRLNALRRYEVVDTPPEEAFDRIARFAQRLFDAPVVLVTLIDEEDQYFKSCYGVDMEGTPRELSFCTYTILEDKVMVVPNAPEDPRFSDNPLVAGDPNIRFYAGAPLHTPDGFNIGTLCLIDFKTRSLSESEQATLTDLAAMVVDELELRREVNRRKEAEARIMRAYKNISYTLASISDAFLSVDTQGRLTYVNKEAGRLFNQSQGQLLGQNIKTLFPSSFNTIFATHYASAKENSQSSMFEALYPPLATWFRVHVYPFERGVSVYFTNITAQKRDALALRESETRKRAIVESSLDAIVTINQAGRVVEFNSAAEHIFGYPRNQMLGQRMEEYLVPPRLRKDLQQGMHHYLASASAGEQKRGELTALRADGSEFPVEVSVSHIDLGENHQLYTAFVRDITERQAAQRALEQSEARSRALLQAVPDAVFRMHQDGTYLDYVPAEGFQTLLDPDDFIGRSQAEVLPEPLAKKVAHYIDRALETQEEQRFEYTVGEDETIRYFEARIVAEDRETVVSFVRDITQQKQQEEALRAAKEQFEVLVNTVPGAIFQFKMHQDGAVSFPYMSPGAEEIYSMKAGAIMEDASLIIDIIHEDDRLSFDASIARSAKCFSPWEWEGRVQTQDGLRWVQGTSRPVRQADRSIVWNGHLRDITDRKQAEEALRESEARYRSLTEQASDAILVGERDKGYVEVNTHACEMTGFTREELLAMHPRDLIAEESLEKLPLLWDAYEPGEIYRFERVLKRKDGSVFPVELSAKLIGNGLVQAIVRDITDRRKAEQALRDALEKERALVDLKSRFIATASHEFRTPLAMIRSSANLVQRLYRSNAAKTEKHLGRIREGVDEMMVLMEEVLTLSRMEARQMSFKPERINLHAFLHDVMEEIQVGVGASHQMRWQPPEEQHQILADKKLLRLILTNLLSNAIKYSEAGEEVILATTATDVDVLFTVKDKGIGIPEKDLPHLFDTFHRARNVGAIEGTGLGLAITKEAVGLHGGTIQIESTLGEGTLVQVRLPVNRDERRIVKKEATSV